MQKCKTGMALLHTGPAGLFQPVADFVKLLSKEDIVPMVCDKVIFSAAPIIYLTLPLTALFVIPIAGNTAIAAFEGDLLLVLFVFTLMIITVFLAGWSSMNRYSIIGGVRAILQMMSFEIPMALALIGPAIAAQSLSISTISQWQSTSTWTIFLQPIGFSVLIICFLAELETAPFNIPEAESEVVAGWLTEYSGKKLAMFRLGRNLELILASGLIAALYLGGIQQIAFIPAAVFFLIKNSRSGSTDFIPESYLCTLTLGSINFRNVEISATACNSANSSNPGRNWHIISIS